MNKREAYIISDQIILALAARRKKLGISQYEIANATGISKSSLSNIEKLAQKPTLPTVLMIADYIGADLSAILKNIYKK